MEIKVRYLLRKLEEFDSEPSGGDESDIKYINALQLNESRIGIIFQNADRVKSSISYYNSITNIKNDFSLLEEELKKDL